MNTGRNHFFHIYRYQILPLSQQAPLFINADVKNLKELKERKNDFFLQAISGIKEFKYNRASLVHKVVYNQDNVIIIKMAVNRLLNRGKPDFTEEEIDNWPKLLIAINNEKHIQKLAVSFNRQSFSNTNTIANLIENNLNQFLSNYYLKAHFKPIFTKQYFWDIVKEHPTGITQASFDMISPNMSNISSSLQLDLKTLNETTNTEETTLDLKSDKTSHLTFDRDNEFINSLVDYSSEGGGNISIKVKGYKKRLHTSNSIVEYEIDELEINNTPPSGLAEIFRGILT